MSRVLAGFVLAATGAVTVVAPSPVAAAAPFAKPTANFASAECFTKLPADAGSVRCGYVSVPLKHAEPNGKKIKLAVAVLALRAP